MIKLIKTKHGFITTQKRSNLMKKIKGKDTTYEVIFRKKFWNEGYRYRKNYPKLPGKPDIAFIKQKVVVFIDGEFWHGFNWKDKKKKIKSNKAYWVKKIEKNMARDKAYNKVLKKMQWKVVRFWEKEIKTEGNKCFKAVLKALNK